jgi:hypothetical protein
MIKKGQLEVLMNAIKLGMTDTDACKIARISREWFYEKQRIDEKFAADIDATRAEWKQRNLSIIQRAAIKQWQPAAWLLERKHPDEYALRQKLEHSGKIKTESKITGITEGLSKEKMEALEAKLDAVLRARKS